MHGGNGDRCGMDWAAGMEQVLHCGVNRDLEFCLQRCGQGGFRLNNGGELHREMELLEFPPDAKMIAAEGTCAYDGDAGWRGLRQTRSSYFPSTALRQRA